MLDKCPVTVFVPLSGKLLGLTIPTALLVRADEIIE